MGVAIGDVNNDGRPDVLLTEYRGIKLFLNNGDGTFTDVTKQAGLEDPLWATSACFVDYDRDGWLDLVVVNYVSYHPSHGCEGMRKELDYCPPRQFPGTVTKLYRNLGRPPGSSPKEVRFEDVTLSSGIGKEIGPALGVTAADFDGDGWPDIFVANDGKPNRLWINQRNGKFQDEAVRRGLAYNRMGLAEANMGVAVADVEGDGLGSVFVSHLTEETNALWVQGPRGRFQDRTAAAGLANSRWRGTGFGAFLGDFNNDGAIDLAIVNGRISRGKPASEGLLGPYWCHYAERNQLFASDGKGQFRDMSPSNVPFCGTPGVARGLACGDVNNDGGLDLLVTNIAGRARLFRNVTPNRGHWLLVRAIDPRYHRDAYGAEIQVEAGGRRWVS